MHGHVISGQRTQCRPNILRRGWCFQVPSAANYSHTQNFINANMLREITSLRQDFISALAEIGLVGSKATPSSPELNKSASNINLIKAAMLGGLWPRVVRVHLPDKSIKYDKVSAGTVRRENLATDYKMFDLKEGRVFLHPGSVLFGTSSWNPPFLFYFHKHLSSKVFLRDATKVR